MEDSTLRDLHSETLPAGPDRGREQLVAALDARYFASRNIFRRVISRGLDSLRRLRERVGAQSKDITAGKSELLFFLHDSKFSRYLGPVLTKLGDRARTVTDSRNPDFGASLALPGLIARNAGSALRRFPGLLIAYDRVLGTLVEIRPRCLVVAEGNAPKDEVANQAAAALGIPCVCVQQGWSPFIHPGFRNLAFTKMLVWGRGFADLLSPVSPLQHFDAVGNPALGDPVEENAVIARKGIAFFLQAPSPLIDQGMWEECLDLVRWTCDRFPDFLVIVREHPAHRLSHGERTGFASYTNCRISAPASENIESVLNSSRLSVSVYSTTILESIAAGVLPIIANFTSLPRFWPDVDAAGAGIEVKDLAAAKAAIEKCITQPDYMRSFTAEMNLFRKKFFAAYGSAAAENIVRAIRESALANESAG